MKIFFINNNGGGFADHVEVEEGTTVGAFFAKRYDDNSASNYLIRVNRQVTSASTVLQAGDRVTVTPVKIEGAA